jgi:hypothetical protein
MATTIIIPTTIIAIGYHHPYYHRHYGYYR